VDRLELDRLELDGLVVGERGLELSGEAAAHAAVERNARLQSYVGAWLLTATAVTIAFVVASGGLSGEPIGWQLALLAAVALGEAIELHFRLSGRLTAAFTLIETAVVAAIVLLPPAEAVVAVAGGAMLGNLIRGRPLMRVGFNTAQVTVSTAAAALVFQAFPEVGPAAGGGSVVAAGVAMAAYGVVNFGALIGLLRIIGDGDVARTVREQGWLMGAALLGDVPVGLLGAELALTRPELLPLLLAPVAAVYLAQRGVARTQELLAQTRSDHERLDRVVAGTSDGILLLGEDGTIEVWNDALVRLTGIPASRAMGQYVARVLTGVRLDQPIGERWLLDTADPGNPSQVVEARLQHLVDSDVRVVRESHTFRFDERGRCVGDVVVFTDVTREHELAEMKSDFVARVSHELRTPLTPIKGFAGMLLKRGADMSEDQRELALERIVERTDRMAALVEDLLLVTQLGSDPAELVTPRRCEIRTVVEHTAARFRSDHGGRSIFVSAPGTDVIAMADPERTEQALGHLIDNALRYSDPDTPVEIDLRLDGDDVVIAVTDHGPGIALAQQEVVFDAFHRLEDPLRMTTSGVGVGLFIARRLARAMHGEVTLASRLGAGSTFALRLPQHRAQTVGAFPPVVEPKAAHDSDSISGDDSSQSEVKSA
jgi:signal transduction histidine kinase